MLASGLWLTTHIFSKWVSCTDQITSKKGFKTMQLLRSQHSKKSVACASSFSIFTSFRWSLVKVFLISSVRYCRCFWTPPLHRGSRRHFYLKRVRVRGPNLFRNAILVTDRECCTFYLLPHYNDAAALGPGQEALDSCARLLQADCFILI